MNNKERFEIAIDYLKDIKPLKEIKISKGWQYSSCNENDEYCLTFCRRDYLSNNEYLASELRYIEKANVFALCIYFINYPISGTAKISFIGACIVTPDKHIKFYKVKSQKEIWGKIKRANDDHDRFRYVFQCELLNNSVASWNETFGKLFPLVNYKKVNYSCTINRIDAFLVWINQEEFKHKNTSEQKQIDKLLELPLKDVTKRDLAFRKETTFQRCAFIERVKDDMICIRLFQYNNFTGKIFETVRFYIDKKGMYFCQKNSFGQFITRPFDNEVEATYFFRANKTIFDKSSSFEGTIIDYYKDIIESDTGMGAARILLNCVYYPSLEKFWKQDYKEVIYHFVEAAHYPFNMFLRNNFDNIDPLANSPGKILGINEYQLASIKQFDWNVQTYIVREAKYMVGDETLPSLTNKQTDKLFSMIEEDYKSAAHCFSTCFKLLNEMYSLKTAFSITNNLITVRRNAIFYRDYLTMVKELGMANMYHPQFKDADDIKRMHNEVLEIYNIKKTIVENEKFAKRIETWKKFEYADSDFSVIVPTKAEDLANEGVKLHHCVKSYIGRVTDGATNIVFIRKNTDLEKPFFTVEITNDNTIQQVHGFGNRNTNTEPNLTEFIKKWAKNKKLKLGDINKVR